MAGKLVVKTYLGDFDNVIHHTDPWRTFEQIVSDSNDRFSQEEGIFKGKKLFSGVESSFIDATSLNNPMSSTAAPVRKSSLDEIAAQNPVGIPSDDLSGQLQVPPLREYSRRRPRVGTTAHRVELESRRRTMPARKRRKS